ncbi:MAG TPA: M10 family metallopeptidase C-terminal domain-containing protein [Rhizomicrobium sp.]|nr:M10 family metallopeptidase C-terminal domain-containing protein [Rhizomicrobium sp.]
MKTILKASAAAAALLALSAGAAGASPCLINGTSGDDTLTATPQMPPCDYYVISGFAGDDTLTGAATPDRLWPGSQSLLHNGHDTMTGNGGADIFFLEDTPSATGSNAQEITDFTHGTDFINVYPVCHAHSVTCTYIGNAAFSGTAGEIRYAIPSGSAFGTMQIDWNGNSTADFEVTLDGAPTVSSGDIMFSLPPARHRVPSNAQ